MAGSPVEVRFLGSGDAFGSGGRLQTCLCVSGAGERFLVDCGTTALIGLKRDGIAPDGVSRILVTHLHGDHFGGIPFFVLDAQLVSRRELPLTIAGPPGVEQRVRSAMEVLFPGAWNAARRFALNFVELPARERVGLGPLDVTGYPVVHASGAPAYALRVEFGGKVIAYSGDTEWTPSLPEAADGADLFVCEAYFYEKSVKFHLDYRTLLAHRSELRCARLVATHMSDDLLARLDALDVETARDGLVVQI